MTVRRGGAIMLALGMLSMLPSAQAKDEKKDRVMHYYSSAGPVVVRLKKMDQINWSDKTGASYKATGKKHSVDTDTPQGNKTFTLEEFRVVYPISEAEDQADLVWLQEGEPRVSPPTTGTSLSPVNQVVLKEPGSVEQVMLTSPGPIEIYLRGATTPIRGVLNLQLGGPALTNWIAVDTREGQVLLNKDDITRVQYVKP